MDIEMKRALVFAILTQNDCNCLTMPIMNISPDYMMEKWMIINNHGEPEALLDSVNQGKFRAWVERWEFQLKGG